MAALGLVVSAAAIRFALDPMLGDSAPYLFFVLAVLIATVRFGLWAGVVAVAASAILATFLFVPPRWSLFPLEPQRLVTLASFCLICAGILLFSRRLDLHRTRLERQDMKLGGERRDQRLIDAAQDYAIYELDREGRILTWNRGAERLKGWKAEEIIGQPYTVLHPPESRARNAPDRELKIAAESGRFEEEAVRMRKDGSIFAAHVSLFPLRNQHGEVTGFVKITRDISDRSKSGKAILETRRRMEAIVQSAMDAVISFDEEQRILLFNPAAEKIFGYSSDQILGKPVTKLFPEHLHQKIADDIRRFFRSGVLNKRMDADSELEAIRNSGEEFPIEASISQVTVGGERVGTVILRDITERRASEEARTLLTRELDHRAKNALAVAQALVSLTKADTIDAFAEAVRGRIAALARAHTLLSKSHWRGAPLEQLIRDELSPYAKEGQLALRGPAVVCSAGAVQSLSLLFHELATNAVKHGALSRDTGNVTVEWRLDRDFLSIDWIERHGPPVNQPQREGFGSRLLRQVSGRQLNAEMTFNWERAGLRVEIQMPAELFTPGKAKRPSEDVDAQQERRSEQASEQRSILLVEDEELIALELSAELARLGWAVVGPAATLAEAQALLSRHVDAAVLDVNLRGRSVFPVAEQLEELHVPFVFCTGYEMADFDGRFRNVPVIRKPAHPAAVSAALTDLLKGRAH